MRKLLIIVLLLSFSFNSLGFFGGGMDTGVLYLILKEDMVINGSTYTSLTKQIVEMEREAKRWKYLFEKIKTTISDGDLKDFDKFLKDYRAVNSQLVDSFNSLNDLQKNYYTLFPNETGNLSMNEINKKNKELKYMTEETLKNSNKLLYGQATTGYANDKKYMENQNKLLQKIRSGDVDPNKLTSYIIESLTQTNQILIEMKSINLNMLNQLTQMNQEQITKKKLMEEQVKRDTEKSYKSLKGK